MITISVRKSIRQIDGSCSGCQRRDEDEVYVVELASTIFRVCRDCKSMLGFLFAAPTSLEKLSVERENET